MALDINVKIWWVKTLMEDSHRSILIVAHRAFSTTTAKDYYESSTF